MHPCVPVLALRVIAGAARTCEESEQVSARAGATRVHCTEQTRLSLFRRAAVLARRMPANWREHCANLGRGDEQAVSVTVKPPDGT